MLFALLLLAPFKAALADRATPAWYDQNAIATAPDWHYRVPVNIPAGTAINTTIEVDVDFPALLTQLGISGTFDVNSPRLVRSTGALATNQEFVDTRYLNATDAAGNGRGEIRFTLQDAGAVTYYLYFDITQNTAKAANPQTPINGNFETGAVGTTVPAGWAMTRTNANFDAQIRGSESPSITTDGTGIPGTVTTDGTPFTGADSYLMGSRTNNDPANGNPAVTLTKTFVKPATCTSGFSMRYRIGGWDSSWANAAQTQYDFIRVALTGTVTTVLVGPNAAGANGNYANFPFSPNFGSNGNNAASNTDSGYGPYNGFDTNNAGGHEIGMTQARGSQPWFNPTNTLAAYTTGSTVTLTITSTHTTQYKSWVHIDDVEWCLVNATLGTPEGFGVDIIAPIDTTAYAAGQSLTVTVQADAQATLATNPVVAYVYNPSGTLVAGPVNLPSGGAGVYTNGSVYTFGTGDPTGTWIVRIFAKDASTNALGGTGGIIHIPGQPNAPEAQATYYNIDEQTFTFAGSLGLFNAFDLPLPAGTTPITGNITTKVAGVAFSIGVIRLNTTKTAINTAYVQNTVTVELRDASDSSGAMDATTGCRSTWVSGTLIASTTVNFAAADVGKETASFTVNQAYKNVRVRVLYTGAPAANQGAGCSNDNFAIRPQSFTTAVNDATWTTAGTTRVLNATAYNGTPTHRAGQPFTLRVTAVLPAGATNYLATGNHTGTPSLRTLTCTNPTGTNATTGSSVTCSSCTNGTLTPGTFSVSAGTLVSTTADYNETGTFNLDLHDVDFAAVDAADGTPDNYSNTSAAGTYNQYGRRIPQGATLAVGRFVPDNFVVTTDNVPQLRTFDATCPATRSFTYVGQPVSYSTLPRFLVTAREAGGGTTINYRQCLWNITNGATPSGSPLPNDVTLTYSNNATGPAIDASLAANATTIVPLGNGTGTVTINTLDRISYTRDPATPVAPFNANISLTASVRDDSQTDGSIATSTAATFSDMAFDSGDEIRYGRLRLGNAFGTAVLDLPLTMAVESFDGNFFVTNAADNCTTLLATDIRFAFVSGTNLTSCETAMNPTGTIYFNGGQAASSAPPATVVAPRLAKPGSANNGAVDLVVNLNGASGNTCTAVGGAFPSATNAAKPWLLGNWGTTTYSSNPQGRATFGLYKGPEEFIFLRENY
ncbi:MAG TPA: DUF6701 domain-containing protein [Burkholderiales bacterium]